MLETRPNIKKQIRTIIHFIESTFPTTILVFFLCMAFLLYITGYKVEFIASSSMEPTLNTGQLILAKKINASECDIGDIVTYQAANYTITHRIINENDDSFEFKGDNNYFSDGYIEKSKVLYKVIAY